jgi:uncharacterized repeat protein (TIGR02543 family)
VFAGWFTERGGAGAEYTSASIINNNVILFAHWTIDWSSAFSVTFMPGAADVALHTMPPDQMNAYFAGDLFNLPAQVPTRTGYVFEGWFTSMGGTGTQFTAMSPVNGNVRLYAHWTPEIRFTVSFMPGGDNVDLNTMPATQVNEYRAGDRFNPPSQTPTRSNFFIFAGWFTGEGGTGIQYTNTTIVDSDVTLFAHWARNMSLAMTVMFNPGATGVNATSMPPAQVNEYWPGDLFRPPIQVPTRANFIFAGWFTQQNGRGIQYTHTTPIIGSITLFAHWIRV